MVCGTMITALVVVLATGLALYSIFKAPPPPPLPPPPYRKHQRRRSRRRSSSSSSSDHSSDSKDSRSSGFESSFFSKANSVYSESPKVKSDPGLETPRSVDYQSRSGSSVPNSSNSKSRSSFPVVSRRPVSADSNSTKSSSRSGSSSSKSKSSSGSVASSSSFSKCESWSVTSERHLDENGFPLCLRSESCITCGDKESDVVTFFPCGGSYLCRKCAFKFLDIGNYCCKCGLEIENVFLKK